MRIYTSKSTTCGHLPHHGNGLCRPCYKRVYRERNRESLVIYDREYRTHNREAKRASGRIYAREWRAKNQTPTRNSWRMMIQRCANPKYIGWKYYGGRGIRVCDRWQGSEGFANFLADMGERPEGKSIDRIDNERGYELGNCRWATGGEQRNNRRR